MLPQLRSTIRRFEARCNSKSLNPFLSWTFISSSTSTFNSNQKLWTVITLAYQYAISFVYCMNKVTLFFFSKNVVFPVQVEYSYSSADFRLKIF